MKAPAVSRLRTHRSSLSSVAPIALLLTLPASARSSVLARLTTWTSFFERLLAPMRVVIVGGGLAGLTLARLLRAQGRDPVVLERQRAERWLPRPFMLPYQGFEALRAASVLDAVRAIGWDIAPDREGRPVAVAADFVRVVGLVAEG